MDIEQHSSVRAFLSSSVTELFDSYGVPCVPVDEDVADSAELELGSIVGFRGKSVRGGLAFVAPMELIADLLPVPKDSQRVEMQVRDWSAEIANQLVGRLKNKLSAKAIDFDIGVPVCFTGRAIRLVFLPGAEGLSLCFRAASTAIRVHLDCAFATDFADADVEELRIVAEGDVLLF